MIDPPEPGGMDVVLDRIRPLAAPLVLSSRRLDPVALPGQTVPPGAIWEVIVAKHPEQALIEKNRGLDNHLRYRQMAHSLVRSFANQDVQSRLSTTLAKVATGVYPADNAPLATPKFQLAVGANTFDIDLTGHQTLDKLRDEINGKHAGVTASVSPIPPPPSTPATTPTPARAFQLVIGPASTSSVGAIRLLAIDGTTKTNIVGEAIDLSPSRFVLPVNSRPTNDPKRLAPPKLPPAPAKLNHIDWTRLDPLGDDARSLDLPLRSSSFSQGVLALQWQALPYYYHYHLMLIAQTSRVSSPITTVEARDFEYVSPLPSASMEAVLTPDGKGRRRRILIRLERYWDCLPDAAQRRWAIEGPTSVPDGDPLDSKTWVRTLSSLPDPDVIYQVVIRQKSLNIQILAEYRSNPLEVSGYESRPIQGQFQGDAIRAISPADGPTVGKQFIHLETLLTRVSGPATDNAETVEVVSGKRKFAAASGAGVPIASPPHMITACVLRTDESADLSKAVLDDLAVLAEQSDVSFAVPITQLLAQRGGTRYAEACIGLEQLAELHDAVELDKVARSIIWTGPMTSNEHTVILGDGTPGNSGWAGMSLFRATLESIPRVIHDYVARKTCPFDPSNPTTIAGVSSALAITTAPGSTTTELTWTGLFTGQKPSPADITAMNAAKTGAKAEFAKAIDDLISLTSDETKVPVTIPILESFWKPRPTQETLPASLQGVLLVGSGVIQFAGMMTLDEGKTLQGLTALSAPDKAAVGRLFDKSLNSGLGGGTLQIRARRGGAEPKLSKIVGELSRT